MINFICQLLFVAFCHLVLFVVGASDERERERNARPRELCLGVKGKLREPWKVNRTFVSANLNTLGLSP